MDLDQIYGDDLSLSATGNFATVDGSLLTSQTVVRYILTNPGDDPFNPTFGLGAGQMIGENNELAQVQALITKGLKTLDVIDQTQPITVQAYYDDDYTLWANLSYTDASGAPVSTSIPVQ